jgi:hypothetical protein
MARRKVHQLRRLLGLGLLVATCLLATPLQASTVCETVSPTIMLHVDSMPYVSPPISDIPLMPLLTHRRSTVLPTRVCLCYRWVRKEREIAR